MRLFLPESFSAANPSVKENAVRENAVSTRTLLIRFDMWGPFWLMVAGGQYVNQRRPSRALRVARP